MPDVKLCGFTIQPLTLAEWVDLLVDRANRGQGAWVVTLNLEMVSRDRRDKAYGQLIRSCDLMVADGMPIVWASRKKKGTTPIPERVTGVELTRALLDRFDPTEMAVVGGENPRATIQTLGIPRGDEIFIDDSRISLEPEAVQALAARLVGRKVLFIALGVPKQDRLAAELRKAMPHAVILGIGGTFELLGGQKKRAPEWMQARGLEWLYRLVSEPKRLWRRYLVEYWGGGFSLVRDVMKKEPAQSSESGN